MKKLLNDVAAFQAAYDAPCHPSRQAARTSGDLTPERVLLRLNLVAEEFFELCGAHGVNTETMEAQYRGFTQLVPGPDGTTCSPYLKDVPEIADGIGDIIYVLVGMALEYGIPLDHVWQAIQDSNMKKFPGGKVIRRESDGKVMKPEGWAPPDIEAALQKVTEASWYKAPEEKPKSIRDIVEDRAIQRERDLMRALNPDGPITYMTSQAEHDTHRIDALLELLSEMEEETGRVL